MQNVDYPASWDRVLVDAVYETGGVISGFEVTPGTGLEVLVSAGRAVIEGDEVPGQGKYLVDSDSTVSLVLAPVGVDRTEYIYIAVNDAAVAGGRAGDSATIESGSSVPISATLLATLTLGFGTITITGGMIADSRVSAVVGVTDESVTDAKLRNSAGLSVIGRSAISTGAPADIAATTSGHVLRRSGSTIGFGTIDGNAGITDATIPVAKMTVANGCHLLRSSATLAANGLVTISWSSEADDNGGFWSSGTTATVPAALGGIYAVSLLIKRNSGSGVIDGVESSLNIDTIAPQPVSVADGVDIDSSFTTNTKVKTLTWIGRLAGGIGINATLKESSGSSLVYTAELQIWQIGRY